MAITREQFDKARASGLSIEKIVEFTKRQEEEADVKQPMKIPGSFDWGSMDLDTRKEAIGEVRSNRPEALKALTDEMKYNPWTDDKLNIKGKAQAALFKPAVSSLKALGAVGRGYESGLVGASERIANEVVEKGVGRQFVDIATDPFNTDKSIRSRLIDPFGMKEPLERILTRDTLEDMVTGDKEYGDVARLGGTSERTAQILGLVMAALEPGMSEVAGATKAPVQNLDKIVSASKTKIGRSIISGHLRLAAGRPVRAIKRFLDDPEKIVLPSLDEAGVGRFIKMRFNKLRNVGNEVVRRSGERFGNIAAFYDNEIVEVTQKGLDSITESVTGRIVKNASGNARVVRTGKQAGLERVLPKNISGINIITDTINKINKKVYKKGKTTVRFLRETLGELDGKIASWTQRDAITGRTSIKPGYEKATAMGSILRKKIGEAINIDRPDLLAARQKAAAAYKVRGALKDILDFSDERIDKSDDIASSIYSRLDGLDDDIRKAFTDLLGVKGQRLLSHIEDLAATHSFKKLAPTKGLSATAGGVAALAALSGQPQMAIGIGAALTATSPRIMGNMYRRVLGTTAKAGKITEKFFEKGKPIADAIVAVGNKFLVAPMATTAPRRLDALDKFSGGAK